jgi:large subunit ribosomal protein L4e
MSAARPVVTVFSAEDAKAKTSVAMPKVFETPLRPDLVNFVADQMRLNTRQAYAVSTNAGYQTAAISWGTGRAVSRIPRVPGGGTHRAGQAAFGNMCRGGGMFAPTKVWRKWHHKINKNQRRHAVCAAIAASAIPALVMSHGHRINEVEELPLVVSSEMESIQRTKDAAALLAKLGLKEELDAVVDSKRIRAGKGKHRNRRFVMKKGPLVIYNKDEGIKKAFRNIPGVEFCDVNSLCLLKMAPGGRLGRLMVWTEAAFKALTAIYGNQRAECPQKKGYHMPRSIMTNSDLHRLINSDEIQSIVRPMKTGTTERKTRPKNPLRNAQLMDKLNPGASHRKTLRQQALVKDTREWKVIQGKRAKMLKARKSHRANKKAFFKALKESYVPKVAEQTNDEEEE